MCSLFGFSDVSGPTPTSGTRLLGASFMGGGRADRPGMQPVIDDSPLSGDICSAIRQLSSLFVRPSHCRRGG